MAAVLLDLQNSDDVRDVIHQAVEALSAGKIVAIPTETVYGLAVSPLVPQAVERLRAIKGRDADKPMSFAVKSCDAALDYVPDMSPLARRLARRCWPGPVTLVLDASHPDSVINRLDEAVRNVTIPAGTVGLRVPDHERVLQIMHLCAGPMLLTSANLSGQPDAVDAEQVMESLGADVDLVLNDGRCHFARPSSVVRVDNDQFQLLREGVVDEATLKNMSGMIILVVCTGNTCRSPMAEALLKKQLASAVGCRIDQLEESKVQVFSAGIAALPGSPPSPQALATMKEMGLDISQHASQPITGKMARHADVILTMTRGHREALIAHWPHLEPRTMTLRADGGDVTDPIGASMEVYRQCADQIDQQLENWVKQQDVSNFTG